MATSIMMYLVPGILISTVIQLPGAMEDSHSAQNSTSKKDLVSTRNYGRTTCGISNWGIQNLLNFYMKVDLVEGNFNIV